MRPRARAGSKWPQTSDPEWIQAVVVAFKDYVIHMTTISSFNDLGLIEPLLKALSNEKYTSPTPIQQQTIPQLLEGRNVLGIAQTGTGKTAAFALPILQRLSAEATRPAPKGARALILAPTRELALQIAESFQTYGRNLKLRSTVIFGGVNQLRQVKAMAHGVDILVATPGRLLDLINQGHVQLKTTNTLVLDEADRMLDMGFIRDIRKIIAAMPTARQSLLFSATMAPEIEKLARDILVDPVKVEVKAQTLTVERIDQRVYHIDMSEKRELLEELLGDKDFSRVIVFTRTKHGANRVSEHLGKRGISSDAIHGNKSQTARQKALERFRNGNARVLVATDIAARGIDVSDVSHVINYELPNEPESYVHRIGRTARAGMEGIAISFCDETERAYLRDIEKLTRQRLTVIGEEPAGPIMAAPKRNSGNRGNRTKAKPFSPKAANGRQGHNSRRPSRTRAA